MVFIARFIRAGLYPCRLGLRALVFVPLVVGCAESSSDDPALDHASEPCVGAACSQCPAPRTDERLTCTKETLWARDPETRNCCAYESPCGVPFGWPLFSTEGECQTDCQCERLTNGTAYSSLECACTEGGCVETIEERTAELCEEINYAAVVRAQGCGMIALLVNGSFAGGSWVFDEASHALIGMSSYSDLAYLPCNTFRTIAGREFVCEGAHSCTLCGLPERADPELPACE